MKKPIFIIVSLFFLFYGCSDSVDLRNHSYNQGINVIPKPKEMTMGEGHFILTKKCYWKYDEVALAPIVDFFTEKISASTGIELPTDNKLSKNAIVLSVDSNLNLHNEGYTLTVNDSGINIVGKSPHGVFYALQTFLQLLPAEIENHSVMEKVFWDIPYINIKDEPRFNYRGAMHDACRHFLPIENIKKHLDIMAMFKINRFHWHLTEDQAWRIEIKKYPKLTEKGAFRTENGEKHGGFYTQEEIKEVVKYASDRFISVIPEIELPGHALAAMSAFPDLACFPDNFTPRILWGVEDDVFCAGKESTFKMLEDIFSEVIPLFPGEYIHIGGDECPKTKWKKCPLCQKRIKENKLKDEHELQSYFIQRIEKFINKHGKKIIGWDEIMEGGLAPSATVMSWRGESGGIAAANMNHDVIMTPASGGLYLDHYQGDPYVEPLAIGGYAPLEKTYSYEPIPEALPAEKQKYILGAQCNLWSEYLYSPQLVEYRAYPRTIALAELTWSPSAKRDFNDFCNRLNNAFIRLDAHKINYHIPLPEQEGGSCNYIAYTDSAVLQFKSSRPIKIVYSLDQSEPNKQSSTYTDPIVFKEDKILKIASVLPTGKMSNVRTITIAKEIFSPGITVNNPKKGLHSKISMQRFYNTKELNKIDTWNEGTIDNLSKLIVTDIENSDRHEKPYGIIASGYILIPEDGIYLFRSDNHEVWIDEEKIIDNNNIPKKYTHSTVSKALGKGLHPLCVISLGEIRGGWPTYWNSGNIFIKKYGKENEFKPISADMLFH